MSFRRGIPTFDSTPQSSPRKLGSGIVPLPDTYPSSPPGIDRQTQPNVTTSNIGRTSQNTYSSVRSPLSARQPNRILSTKRRVSPRPRKPLSSLSNSMSAKVQKITDFITKKRTTPTAYIKAYVLQEFEDQTGRGIQRAATTRRQKNFAQMIVADEEFRNIINENEDGVAIHTEEEMIEQLLKQLCDELSSLESSTAFSSWQVSDEWNGRPSFESINFKKAIRDIEETAPTWARLVCDVTRNKRADWNSYTAGKNKSQQSEADSSSASFDSTGILYLMTTAVMYQRARKTANRAATDLGLYLESNGTKDRVITFLSRLGLCPSVDTIRRRRADITEYSEKRVANLRDKPGVMIVYDNFDFKDSVKDQAVGSTHEMRHFTTAYAFTSSKVDKDGLTQSMLRRYIPLSEAAIIRAAAQTWIKTDRSWFNQMRFRTMEMTIKDAFNRWRRLHSIKFPLPTAEKKSHEPTEPFYLGAIHANSSTAEGTAQVHEYLIEKELGIPIESSDDIFGNRLFLFHGDQKTVENCRAARTEQEDSECVFNRRNWLLPIPALFHVVMNLSTVFLRSFWAPYNKEGETRLRTTHCILADMQRFGFKNISQDNAPWYDLHRLIQMAYYSRVFAMFLQCLEARHKVEKHTHKSAESLQTILTTLTPADFDAIWTTLNANFFSKHAIEGKLRQASVDGTRDETSELPDHITALARFTQTMHVYLVLHQAIRYGDVQTIRHLLPLLALLFLGTEKNKYGREMLYLSWLLDEKVSDLKLQDAILDSLLINTSGRQDSFLPVDRFLEHINAVLKIDQKMEKNSTHDWRQTFHSTVRTIPYLAGLKKAMERMVGYTLKGKHHVKDMSSDIVDYAIKLWHDGQTDWSRSFENQYVPENIIQQGLKRLPKAIQSFNEDVVDCPDRYVPPRHNDGEDDAGINGFNPPDQNDVAVDGFNSAGRSTSNSDSVMPRITVEDSIAELNELGEDGMLDDVTAFYGRETYGNEANVE